MKMNECYPMPAEKPKGHTREADWRMGNDRPTATPREEYAQADKTTGEQISESGLTARHPL